MKRVIEGKTYNTDTATRILNTTTRTRRGYSVTVDLTRTGAAPSSSCIRGKRTTSTWGPPDGTFSRQSAVMESTGCSPAASPKGGIEVFDEKTLRRKPRRKKSRR